MEGWMDGWMDEPLYHNVTRVKRVNWIYSLFLPCSVLLTRQLVQTVRGFLHKM